MFYFRVVTLFEYKKKHINDVSPNNKYNGFSRFKKKYNDFICFQNSEKIGMFYLFIYFWR